MLAHAHMGTCARVCAEKNIAIYTLAGHAYFCCGRALLSAKRRKGDVKNKTLAPPERVGVAFPL